MLTIEGTTTFEESVKESRFIAHAARVDSSEATQLFLKEVGDPSATHNCWAWRIGDDYRSSDDGEPGGTAGRPILATIDGHGVDHVMVVVTRYYGGTKLGTGGLVRAYGGAASKCLDRAQVVEEVPMIEVSVTTGFSDIATVHATATAHDGSVASEDFRSDGVTATVALPESSLDVFRTTLLDATSGRAAVGEP